MKHSVIHLSFQRQSVGLLFQSTATLALAQRCLSEPLSAAIVIGHLCRAKQRANQIRFLS